MPHYGPTNKKLRCFLPLFVPETIPTNSINNANSDTVSSHSTAIGSSWLQVDGQRIYLRNGECSVFDDSFYHEAGNEHPTAPRIVLILDIWHPDLTPEEVSALNYIVTLQQFDCGYVSVSFQ